jgi:hypothetical protein
MNRNCFIGFDDNIEFLIEESIGTKLRLRKSLELLILNSDAIVKGNFNPNTKANEKSLIKGIDKYMDMHNDNNIL